MNLEEEQSIEAESAEEPVRGRSRRPGVVISARDLELLSWVAEHRFSTKAILIERFYSEPSRLKEGAQASGQYGAVRLRMLIKQGYLRPSRYRILREAPLLVSDLGYKVLHGVGRLAEYRGFPDIDIENFEHDVWAQRCRIQLERDHGCHSWVTERAMKAMQQEKELPYLPDGRFLSSAGQAWNLEVERTPKRLDRLKNILDTRARASRRSKVLYVLDRRFSEFYRHLMSVTVNPGCFFATHFDDFANVLCGSAGWRSLPLGEVLSSSREDRHE